MVRVNLVSPRVLSDQHLVGEYNELLMLLGYVLKYPVVRGDQPSTYTLGSGHIRFFKDKVRYVGKRWQLLKFEMMERGFKTMNYSEVWEKYFSKVPDRLFNDWSPGKRDYIVVSQRVMDRINSKPGQWRYYGEYKSPSFFSDLIQGFLEKKKVWKAIYLK